MIRRSPIMGEEDYGDFLTWAAAIGITDGPGAPGLGHALRIASFPHAGGRGLAATRNLEKDEIILKVPRSALIGVHCAKEDPLLSKLLPQFPELSSQQILAVYVLSELDKGTSSRFWYYLRHLPRAHHTLAQFSESEIEALQDEGAIGIAKASAEKAERDFHSALFLLKKLCLKRRFTGLKAWLWAAATVSSRALFVPWDGAGVLCPFGDLFNYEAPGDTYTGTNIDDVFHGKFSFDVVRQKLEQKLASEYNLLQQNMEASSMYGIELRERLSDGGYESSIDAYCFYARKRYSEGQQVLLCYGQYSNLELLEHYGFLLPKNPNDLLHVTLPDACEFGHNSSNQCDRLHAGCFIDVYGRPSFSLLQGLRLRAAPCHLRKSLGYLASQGCSISTEGDANVYKWLLKKCHCLLAKLTTTIAEDIILLKLSELSGGSFDIIPSCSEVVMFELETMVRERSENWRLSVEWRLAHKMILQRCIWYTRQKLDS